MKSKKIALVTGANRGIGLEVCRQLAERGLQVFLSARNLHAGEKASAQLRQLGGNVAFVPLDVTSPTSVQNAARTVAAQIDHLDVLVNNAAILEGDNSSILNVSEELLHKTLLTNAIAPLLVTQAFMPLLAKGEHGRVINVSSGSGSLNEMTTYAPAYSISKTALNAVTLQLALALKSKQIAVNSVCPGWVRTDMGGRRAPRSAAEGADTIVWLATEAPPTLTGKFLRDRQIIPW